MMYSERDRKSAGLIMSDYIGMEDCLRISYQFDLDGCNLQDFHNYLGGIILDEFNDRLGKIDIVVTKWNRNNES